MIRTAALLALFGYAAATAAQLHCPMAGMEAHGHAARHLAGPATSPHDAHAAHAPQHEHAASGVHEHDDYEPAHEHPGDDCWMSAGCVASTGVALALAAAEPLSPTDARATMAHGSGGDSAPSSTEPPPPRSA